MGIQYENGDKYIEKSINKKPVYCNQCIYYLRDKNIYTGEIKHLCYGLGWKDCVGGDIPDDPFIINKNKDCLFYKSTLFSRILAKLVY